MKRTSRTRRELPGDAGRGTNATTIALAGALALLVLSRAAVTFAPSMALWGLNVQRFLDPWWAWVPWLLAAMTLAPPIARRLLPAVEAVGRTVVAKPSVVSLVVGLAAAALVFAFPDRLYYVGDFLMRLGGLKEGENPVVLSPQAFPLDVWVHYALPLGAEAAGWTDVHTAARLVGAVGAGLLGGASVLLARALRVTPAATTVAMAITLFGGHLCLYTGESKAFAETCIVIAAFSGFAFTAIGGGIQRPSGAKAREGDGAGALLGAGICLAVGILFHRFALGLIPAALVTVAIWGRGRRGVRGVPSAATVLAATIPLTVFVVMAPRIWRTVVTYDLGANFATAEARAEGGVLAAALDPARLLDVLNLILFLTPMVVVAVIAAVVDRDAGGRDPGTDALRRHQAWLAAAVAVPFVFVFLFARPPQGLVRDWDSFAAAGIGLGVWAAWRIAQAIDRPGRAWIAVALVAAVTMSAVQWLVHYADASRGFSRLEALMLEPPGRPAVDRARTWDFLGWRYFRGERYEDSARAFEQAVTGAPSARNLTHWAMAETMRGRHDRALEIYMRAAERDSNLVIAWFGVGVSGINSGNRAAVEGAVPHLVRLAPENDKTREIVDWLGTH